MSAPPPRRTVRVRDVMSPFPTWLARDASLADAARKLTNEGVSGAPVVEDGVLVGVLSRADLVERSPFIPHAATGRVENAMTKKPITVRGHDPAMSAARLLVEARIHRVVVVDGANKPIGIVTPTDILKSLLRGDPLQEGEDAFLARKERHGAPAQAVQADERRSR